MEYTILESLNDGKIIININNINYIRKVKESKSYNDPSITVPEHFMIVMTGGSIIELDPIYKTFDYIKDFNKDKW